MHRDEAAMRASPLAHPAVPPKGAASRGVTAGLVLATSVLAVVLLMTGPTRAVAEACRPDEKGVPVCGEGKDAVRVIADTTAPSGRFAFAWGGPDGVAVEQADPNDVHTVLVRLADGARLTALGGQYWETQAYRANREELLAIWAPGERGVVEIANNRWSTYSLAYHTLAPDGATRRLDLLKPIEAAARAKLRPGKGRTQDDYTFQISGDRPVAFDSSGRLQLTAMLYVIKTDHVVEFTTVVALRERAGAPVAEIVSMSRAPSRF